MSAPLRELVLNETRAHAVFGNGRLADHRFAISLVCDELPDPRFNRAFILEPEHLTPESLEEISRDFLSVRYEFRMDLFLPIPSETQSLLERRDFAMTEDYTCEMVLGRSSTALMRNPAVKVEALSEQTLDMFLRVMLKAYGTPSDVAMTLRSIFRRTAPRALGHRGAALYLAFIGPEPVGTLYLFSQGGVGGLYNLAVTQSARRQGVATTLLLQAIEDSRTAGNTTLCIRAPMGSFHERFLERVGFKTVARCKRATRKQA
jgi:GNAT superfamily N-acetyltransferase